MPNKTRERRQLILLWRLINDFPVGMADAGESPDFIVGPEDGAIGIEFTEFHLPPPDNERPHQELQALKNRVVRTAHVLHLAAGGPTLYVSVFFRDAINLSKGRVNAIAEQVARAVSQTPTGHFPETSTVAWELLPAEVVDISVRASFNGYDQLWWADAGGWIAKIMPFHVESVIRQKTRMLHLAKMKCSKVWLVIVHDVFSHAAPAELSNSAMGYHYDSPFDRLLWLEPHVDRVFDLIARPEPDPQLTP